MKHFLFCIVVLSLQTFYLHVSAQTTCAVPSTFNGSIDVTLPHLRKDPLILGVNTHSINHGNYTGNWLNGYNPNLGEIGSVEAMKVVWKKQFDYIRELGGNFIRVNTGIRTSYSGICKDSNCNIGDVSGIYYGNAFFKGFAEYTGEYKSTTSHELKALIVLDNLIEGLDFTKNETSNYNEGILIGKNFYTNVLKNISEANRPKYFELTNEVSIAGLQDPVSKKFVNTRVSKEIFANPALALSNALSGILYGDEIYHYNYQQVGLLVQFLAGVSDGLKCEPWGQQNIKIVFGTSGFDYGLLKMINFYNQGAPNHRFNYDIISWHCYNTLDKSIDPVRNIPLGDMKHLLVKTDDSHTTYINLIQNIRDASVWQDIITSLDYQAPPSLPNKDLWITEFGHAPVCPYPTIQKFYDDMSYIDKKMTTMFNSYDDVQAIFQYELYTDGSPEEANCEQDNKKSLAGKFGLVNCAEVGCFNSSKNAAFNGVQQEYQSARSGYQDIIYSWYVDLNGRIPESSSGLDHWTERLKCSKNYHGTVVDLMKSEFYYRFIRDQFWSITDRELNNNDPNDIAILSSYYNLINSSNPSFEEFKIQLFTSSHFLNRAKQLYPGVSDNDAFLLHLFRVTHGLSDARQVGGGVGYNYWLDVLKTKTWNGNIINQDAKKFVAGSFLTSEFYIKKMIDQGFQLILKRSYIPLTTDYWYQQIFSGKTNEHSFLVSLLYSEEYRIRTKQIGITKRLSSPGGCNAFISHGFCKFDNLNCSTVYPNATVSNGPITYTRNGYNFRNEQGVSPRIGDKEEFDFESNNEEGLSDNLIAPNPFHSTLLIDIPVNNDFQGDIQLYNELGEEKLFQSFESIKENKIIVNTSDYAPGLYFLRIRTGQQIKVHKLFKQ